MVFIMVTSIYPPHQAEHVGKAFVGKSVPDVADFVKRVNIWVAADYDTKVYALYEVPDEKMFDGLKSISTRYAGYRIIEGFKYNIEPLLTVKDALPMIGLG
jgi:hypothetical protein